MYDQFLHSTYNNLHWSTCLISISIWTTTRQPGFGGVRTTKAQTSLHIWKYRITSCYERNFNYLTSLCSWADWFQSNFVGNPEDRVSRVPAHTYEPVHEIWIYGIWNSEGLCKIAHPHSLANTFAKTYLISERHDFNEFGSLCFLEACHKVSVQSNSMVWEKISSRLP